MHLSAIARCGDSAVILDDWTTRRRHVNLSRWSIHS